MLDSFLTFINQQKWDLGKQKTLLAVSGGVDSVVMAHLFYKAGFDAIIAHCNFGLRASESDEDEDFVRQLALRYGYPIFVKQFDTKVYAKTHSISTQMAARDLRYEWFRELTTLSSCAWVATAHHLNDSIETSLLNLSRGTGLAGIHGISAEANGVIRPLLFATRSEIQHYLVENEISWREDRSNATMDYKRNRIRHEVIPVLRALNPSLEHTFKTTSARLRSADNLLSTFMNDWMNSFVQKVGEEIHMSVSSLLSMAEPTYALWFIVDRYGFGYQQVQSIVDSLPGTSGKVFYSSEFTILLDRDLLILRLTPGLPQSTNWILDKSSGQYQMGDVQLLFGEFERTASFNPGRDKNVAYFDRNKLVFPLSVRHWMAGDRFCPLGMGGKGKKVSDLLIDSKMSVFDKQKVCVLLNGTGEILWVVGIRADDRFKVLPFTTGVLRVTLTSVDE